MPCDKINLAGLLSEISTYWSPKIIGDVNGHHVKLAKFLGDFPWHHHEQEDEMFLVLEGRFRMEFRDRDVWVERGEMLIVPRGVEHRPVADEEASVLLVEPASTLNTGNVVDVRTVFHPERLHAHPR